MEKYKSIVMRGVLSCFSILMAGCASSELVDIWSDSSFQPPSLNKMLVLSVSKNPAQRRIWEDAFRVELVKHGITTTPSYSLFPNVLPDTNQIIQIMQSHGYDGILFYRRLSRETITQYKQGFGMSGNNRVYDRYTKSFVASYFRDVDYAEHVDSQKVDIRAIDVWTTKNEGQMIWSARSETPEPNSIQEVRPEIVKLVMSELTKQRIIAAER